MKNVTFCIAIGFTSDIEIDFDVTEEEYRLLKTYAAASRGEGDDADPVEFCDCEALAPLYRRVTDAAYDAMAESVADDAYFVERFCDREYDFDAMREGLEAEQALCVDWPELDDDGA